MSVLSKIKGSYCNLSVLTDYDVNAYDAVYLHTRKGLVHRTSKKSENIRGLIHEQAWRINSYFKD